MRISDWSSDVCSSDLEFARQAEARGAHVVLFTDPWMSPIAEIADVVIIASVEVDSPYDSLAPAVAQIEALFAHAVVREQRATERRVADLERLRRPDAVTRDPPRRTGRAHTRMRRRSLSGLRAA